MRHVCFALTFGLVLACTAARADEQLDKLIQSASSGDMATRIAAIDELANLGVKAKPAMATLQKALSDNDTEIRWRAARSLGAIGLEGKEAIPDLAKALDDPDPTVRAYAAFALGEIDADAEDVVSKLLTLILDEDVAVRRATIKALRSIDPPQEVTAPFIVKMFEKADPALVSMAIKTVAEDGAKAVPRLSKALEHPDACYWACLALQEIGPEAKDAVPNLRKVLTHEHEEVRMQALMALGEIGEASAPAKQEIVDILENDKFGGVRFAAAYALGKIGQKEGANEALLKTLEDKDEFLRTISAWALARLNKEDKQLGTRCAEVIVAGLTSPDKNVRAASARALAEFEGYEGVVGPALVAALKDPDPIVVGNALDALASMGAKMVPGIEKGLKNKETRGLALRVVQRLGDDGKLAIPAVIEAISVDDGDDEFRTRAQFMLGLFGADAKAAIPVLLQSLGSQSESVRNSAIYALAKMGPAAKPAGRALVKILESSEADSYTRLSSGWALLEITNNDPLIASRVAPLLRQALTHEDPSVRGEAARSLGNLGEHGRQAIADLKKLSAEDYDQEVREAAKTALEKLLNP